jgi:organic hydroperoxide reductase OsmC/OhrA
MQDLPHHYAVSASAGPEGNVTLSSAGAPQLPSNAPAEFGGPGDEWSPETLLTAAVADCFILSFRAIARASKFEWNSLSCEVEAVLERIEKVTKFTAFNERVVLEIPAGMDEAKAQRLLEMAERSCLVTNSLTGETHLEATVKMAG